MDQENIPQQQPSQPPPPPKKRKGCRIALIVVGVLVIILAIGGYFVCTHMQQIASFAVDKTLTALEAKVIEDLPPGYDEAEVRATFEKVRTAFKEGKIKGDNVAIQVQETSQVIQAALQDGKLTPEETDKILEKMNDLLRLADNNK